jgi:hypothetical protein
MYGLDNQNYRKYLSDWTYYHSQPVNGSYSTWIDDKLTMKYILQPFDKFLPRYYFQLDKGGLVARLMDCPDGCDGSLESVLGLLEKEGCLAVKPIIGFRGSGFVKLSCIEGQFGLNSDQVSRESVVSFLEQAKGYATQQFGYKVRIRDLREIN